MQAAPHWMVFIKTSDEAFVSDLYATAPSGTWEHLMKSKCQKDSEAQPALLHTGCHWPASLPRVVCYRAGAGLESRRWRGGTARRQGQSRWRGWVSATGVQHGRSGPASSTSLRPSWTMVTIRAKSSHIVVVLRRGCVSLTARTTAGNLGFVEWGTAGALGREETCSGNQRAAAPPLPIFLAGAG